MLYDPIITKYCLPYLVSGEYNYMYYLYIMNYVPDTDLGYGPLLHYYSGLQQLWLDTR